MNMNYRYTKNQVARGTRADAERNNTIYLLKNVSMLRLTYQIRLQTFNAYRTAKILIVRVPKQCKLDSELLGFQKEHTQFIRIERMA
jgi:hypothetical protein